MLRKVLLTTLVFTVSVPIIETNDVTVYDQSPCVSKPNKQLSSAKNSAEELAEALIDTSFTIEAIWIGDPQWMGGVDNSYETFGGSVARGHNFFGSSLLPSQFAPVEIRLSSDSSEWSNVQIFRRTGFGSVGVGTFPGSAWDLNDPNNPRRLNLCTVECYNCGELNPPDVHNGVWDPDTSYFANFEFLFVMHSDYDSTGMTYSGNNILSDDLDILYGWWPKVALGHTFFESDTGILKITPNIGLNLSPRDTAIELDWVYPGPNPDHFNIYYATDSSAGTFLATVLGSRRTFIHNGLVLGQEYYYQIKSYDSANNEIYSSEVKGTRTRSITMGIELFGQWNLRLDYGDVRGYTDSLTGKEYALICSRFQGLSIIDINDTPLVEVGFVPAPLSGSDVKDVKTYRSYAVIFSESAATMIADISDVTNPVVISQIPGGTHNGYVDGHYVYLVGGSHDALDIYSILDPYNPEYVSTFETYYYHDVAIYNDTLAAFAIYSQGVDILDVTNKSNPKLISHFNYPGSGAHNGAFAHDGKYLFVGDEIGQGNWTRIFDVSDLDSVTYVGDIVVDPFAVVHNCELKGEHLYIAHYIHGLRIWNVSNPEEPYEVAFYDTHPQPDAGYAGAWGVYPYFESGKVIVSDMQNGLFVFNTFLLGSTCCVGTRGDVNGDGSVIPNVLDLTYMVDVLFRGGPDPICDAEADVNNDGISATVLDLTYIIDRIFKSGPAPLPCP